MGKKNKTKDKPVIEDVKKKIESAISKGEKKKRKDFKQKTKIKDPDISNKMNSVPTKPSYAPVEKAASGGSRKVESQTSDQGNDGYNYGGYWAQDNFNFRQWYGNSYENSCYNSRKDNVGPYGSGAGRGKRGYGFQGGYDVGRGGSNSGRGGYNGGRVGHNSGRGGYNRVPYEYNERGFGYNSRRGGCDGGMYKGGNGRQGLYGSGRSSSGFSSDQSQENYNYRKDSAINLGSKDLKRKYQEGTKQQKRPNQSIEEVKKLAKKKKEKAMEVAKELEERTEIADKAAKIKAALSSIQMISSTFSPQRPMHEGQQLYTEERERIIVAPRVKIDKKMVPDLVLSASEIAEVGRGRTMTDPELENAGMSGDTVDDSSRPSVLPAFHDDVVVPLPASSSDIQPRPREAYTPRMFPSHQPRKRTFSESSCLQEPAQKKSNNRDRTSSHSQASSKGQSVDEAMGQLMDKQRVEKLKKSLLNMNKKSLKELVNKPTSSKSRLLMGVLVKDHRSFLSNCLNRSRFSRAEQVEDRIVNLDKELDCLPSNLMIEISDIIKQEVPAIENIIEEGSDEHEFGPLDLNVKCEVVYGQEELGEEQSVMLRQVKEENVPPGSESADAPANIVISPVMSEASTSKSKVSDSTNLINDATRLAPVFKKRGTPCKGQGRRIGGHEVVIGTVGDLVNVQGYETSETDNEDQENIEIDSTTEKAVDSSAENAGNKDVSNQMKTLGLVFEQEASILSALEEVDTKMSDLAQERNKMVQQLQFLSELKRQMIKE